MSSTYYVLDLYPSNGPLGRGYRYRWIDTATGADIISSWVAGRGNANARDAAQRALREYVVEQEQTRLDAEVKALSDYAYDQITTTFEREFGRAIDEGPHGEYSDWAIEVTHGKDDDGEYFRVGLETAGPETHEKCPDMDEARAVIKDICAENVAARLDMLKDRADDREAEACG